MRAWKDINAETPLDRKVLVYAGLDGICVAIQREAPDGRYWMPHPASFEPDAVYPTKWMELPEEPRPYNPGGGVTGVSF